MNWGKLRRDHIFKAGVYKFGVAKMSPPAGSFYSPACGQRSTLSLGLTQHFVSFFYYNTYHTSGIIYSFARAPPALGSRLNVRHFLLVFVFPVFRSISEHLLSKNEEERDAVWYSGKSTELAVGIWGSNPDSATR